MGFLLRNTDNRLVDNVRLAADLQPDWRATFSPELVRSVPIDGEVRVRLVPVPPKDIPIGDYDVKVRTVALSADRQVDTEDKIFEVDPLTCPRCSATMRIMNRDFLRPDPSIRAGRRRVNDATGRWAGVCAAGAGCGWVLKGAASAWR